MKHSPRTALRPLALSLGLAALLALAPACPVAAADPPAVEAKRGMVVAAEPLAAEAGLSILRAGGNAIDAAVATGFALAVTYPVAGNIGGGGFLVGRITTGDDAPRSVALDFRETAPAAAGRDLYVRARELGIESPSTLGHLAAGVPGSVAGLLHALDRWGSLDRAAVLAPAIALAADGFPCGRRTARILANERIASRMMRFPGTARVFYPGGKPIEEGAIFRQPELAATLRLIAEKGADGFYRGEIAGAIVKEMERGGGIITLDDLAAYRPLERKAIRFPFRGHTIIAMPPPSSGGVCLQQMLGILGRYPLDKLGHNSSASLHLLAEAMRRSFADRNRSLGDPDHASLPLDHLLSAAHIEEMARGIDARRATPSAEILGASPAPGAPRRREREQTTHYSVIDRHGSAVAVTTTLNGPFGAKVTVPGAGFLLNNEMDDFTAEPGKPNLYGLIQGEANAVAPGKRPLSSMTPTIVLDGDGRVEAVLGTPGGPTIITNVLQVLLNLFVHGLEAQAAVNAPKIHHQCLPDRIAHERELPADVLEGLRGRGHELRERSWIGDFQLIAVDRRRSLLLGASDPRGGGVARGH
ncbi:MAG: gamma-glutamyltransferase [Planctomycetota bacterium]